MKDLSDPTVCDALIAGAVWTLICVVFDLVGWVLVKHPWSLSFKEFYVEYQPWITMIYIIIFFAPLIGLLFC